MNNLLAEATDSLRSQGGRMTIQRRLILETLESMSSHPSAGDLYSIVNQRDPGIHLSTIYRTLRWLEGEGLISSRWFEEERRQERFDPAIPVDHHHFLCTHCKRVIEFDYPLVDEIIQQFERDSEARIESTAVVLYGLCKNCRG
ncbi:MAG TPA: Fur family transcriptional regulator [Anaerolineales bacterium]|nr:Fur family transcriptional regulator [Anaerolineales bacterium]